MRKYSLFNAIISIVLTAAIAATVFLYFSPEQEINNTLFNRGASQTTDAGEVLPTLLPNDQSRIGIVAGHWGVDSGHTCPAQLNNLREVDVNLRIATLVRDSLVSQGYKVDLMQDFDPNLADFTGLALVAIHTDTCDFINGQATGFKVSSIGRVSYPAEALNLDSCLIDRYQRRTQMNYLGNTISSDPENFYNYDQINDYTTAAAIEIGYLNLDYRMLTEKTDLISKGIAEGILCYINDEASNTASMNQPVYTALSEPEQVTRFILPGIESLTP